METINQLLSFKFPNGICSAILYFAVAVIGSIIIRAIVGFYLSKESQVPKKGSFYKYFLGQPIVSEEDPSKQLRSGDYFLGFFLGVIELLAYPILIFSNNIVLIGAWLLFKTIHRTKYNPNEKRGLYNRYLLANALILIFSYLMCRFILFN